MDIKHGRLKTEISEDGTARHIYIQSINGHSLMDDVFFEGCRKDILECVRHDLYPDILILNTGEPLTDADNGRLLIEFQTFCERVSLKMILVLSSEASQYRDTYLATIKNLHDLNLQLLCYDNCKRALSQQSNDRSTATSGILHLTGKPYKVNRIGFLYQCYLDNVTQAFTVSSWLPSKKNQWVDGILGVTDHDYQNFVNALHNNSVDGIEATMNSDISNFHYAGMAYDAKIYEKNFCSLINETWIHSPMHITEKTWRTIDNLHPFVLMGSPGTIAYLESIGINCYREYLSYPDYDDFTRDHTSSFADLQPWFRKIIRNCLDLAELPLHEKEKLREIARANRSVMQKLIAKNKHNLTKFYDLDVDRLYDVNSI